MASVAQPLRCCSNCAIRWPVAVTAFLHRIARGFQISQHPFFGKNGIFQTGYFFRHFAECGVDTFLPLPPPVSRLTLRSRKSFSLSWLNFTRANNKSTSDLLRFIQLGFLRREYAAPAYVHPVLHQWPSAWSNE